MGNLCSSGTERGEKKEDNRVPDKPRDGEDEALLPTAAVGLGVGPDGVQVSLEGGGGGCGDGFGGNLGTGESALTGATKTGGEGATRVWDEKAHLADVVSAFTAGLAAERAGSVKVAAKETVDQGLQDAENKITDAYQSARGNLEESAGEVMDKVAADAASGVTSVENFVKSEAVTVESEARHLKEDSSAWVTEGAAFADTAADSAKRLSRSCVENVQSETGSANVRSSAEVTPQCGIFENVKEEFGQKVSEVKTIAESVASDAKQTAENKVNETIESVRLSASETISAWTETASQKVGEVTGNVSQEVLEKTDSLGQTMSTQESVDEPRQHSAFGHPDFDSAGFDSTQAGHQQAVLQQVENIRHSGLPHNSEDAGNVGAGAFFEQQSENVRDHLDDFSTSVDEKSQELCNKVQMITSVQETCSAGAEEAWSEVRNAPHNFSDDVQEAYEKSSTEEVADTSSKFALSGSCTQEQREEWSDLFAGVQATTEEELQFAGEYIKGEVLQKVGFSEGARTEENQEASTNEANTEFDEVHRTDEDFLEKAKSLLEAHRSSIDGGRNSVPSVTVTEKDVECSQQTPEHAAGPEGSSHESTAREFVESIIEKATSLVSESLGQSEPASDSSSPSDPVVERGEETLAPKKRGVMFVSPQISDRSSSSLSSASPPLPPQESDLSPLADSSSSSISQCELVETGELLLPPALPAEYSVSENNNNNNNIANNNAEDDDESIQRVAMEVTAKAVQDAIKIVAENGTGIVLNSTDLLNNDIGIGSLSSPDNEDEEVTTTDSSQVERGSPVSDLTDTSAHGSVSESLSSYDPGAVFRQDVTSISELTSAPSCSGTAPHPDTAWPLETSTNQQPHDKMADLINFDDGSTSHADTPTPTNATSFDTYPHQPPQVPSDDPALSSDVPSCLSPVDDLPSSPNKPTIVINSPDSAHHTNGSCEDVASPQTEALI